VADDEDVVDVELVDRIEGHARGSLSEGTSTCESTLTINALP
jgi:hypothetical protein